MCGLGVVLDFQQPISKTLIPALFASMQHRGPDDQTYYHSEHLLACHSRLAVEASMAQGRQPIRSADGRYIVIVNGELYPYQGLRQSLCDWGYCFQGSSDSELALGLFLRYGDDFVNYLRGEYVVIIWDSLSLRLLVVRDRFGIKPLVYTESGRRWILASEAKTLFAAGTARYWSLAGLADSFSFQYLLPGNSLFDGVKLLPPGHMLSIENKRLRCWAYWQPRFAPTAPQSLPCNTQLQSQILATLEASVAMRVPRIHPTAFALSAGLDSSAIVALAQKHLKYPIHGYCVSFDDKPYDEYPQVQTFAKRLGIHLNRVTVCRDDLILGISQAAYFSEGLASNGQYVGKYHLYQKIAADGFRVVMCGEGADEAFMGYAHLIREYCATTPSLQQRETLLNEIASQAKLQHGLMYTDNLQTGFKWPNFLHAKITFCQQFLPLFTPDFRDCFSAAQKQSLLSLQQLIASCAMQSSCPTETSALLWQNLVLPGYILKTLGDGMEMAASLEARLPFLDHKLFELALSLPTAKKIVGTQGKVILRDSLRGILPAQLRQRHKHPFIAPPIADKLSPSTQDYLFDTLCSSDMINTGIFDVNKINQFLLRWRAAATQQKALADPVIMMLLSFAALSKHFALGTRTK